MSTDLLIIEKQLSQRSLSCTWVCLESTPVIAVEANLFMDYSSLSSAFCDISDIVLFVQCEILEGKI